MIHGDGIIYILEPSVSRILVGESDRRFTMMNPV
jgi:hypothetical protein